MNLRSYQTQAVDSVLRDFQRVQSTLCCLPTGTGKSLIFAEVLRQLNNGDSAAIVIAHRQELLTQAQRTIEAHAGLECEYELGERKASEIFPSPVLLASVQTLCSGRNGARRMHKFSPYNYGLLVIDEFHHATAASYRAVIDYFKANKDLKILGVTATPERADEEALGQICESVAFDYPILQAINDGWLVPVQQQLIDIQSLDFSHVRTTAGDLNGADLAAVMESERNLYGICDATMKELGNRKAIMFTVSVRQAEMAADILNRYKSGVARFASGKTPVDERRSIMQGFHEGRFQVLVNCSLVSEGFDVPDAELLIQARPTKSKLLYCLDDQTEILTPEGWKTCDDNFREAYAYNRDDESISVSQIKHGKKFIRPMFSGETMHGIQGRHLDISVTNNHRMLVKTKCFNGSRQILVREAANLPKPGVMIPVAGYLKDTPINTLSQNDLHFIGLLMSDGTINKRQKQITLFQSNRYPEIVRFIDATIKACGFKFTKSTETKDTNFGARSHPLNRWTISFGKPRGRDKDLSGWGRLDKYISRNCSEALSELSRSQLLDLLHAMNLGDGAKFKCPSIYWKPRTMCIASGNYTKLSRLQALCVIRGIRCNIGPMAGRVFKLHVDPTRQWVHLPTSGPRQHWSLLPDVKRVWCVEVDTGFIVCRRKGKVFITGNCQQLGRVMRPLPGTVDGGVAQATPVQRREAIAASSKSVAVVMDFVGNAGRHKLVHAIDILGGKISDEVRELAEAAARKTGRPTAIDEMVMEASMKADAQRRALEAARKARLTAKATYSVRTIDPFDSFDITAPPTRAWDSGKTLSEKQRGLLRRQGLDPDTLDYSAGKTILNEMFRRWNGKLATLRQCHTLKRFGYDTHDLTMQGASELLNQLALNGWKRSDV